MVAKDRLVCSWLVVIVALFGLFLTACGADVEQTVTFKRDEAWEAEMVIILPPETAALAGGLGAIESQLAEAMDELEVMGVTTSLEPGRDNDGNPTYTIYTAGQRLDILENIAFDNGSLSAQMVDGQRQIAVDYYPDLSDGNFTLTLIGGKVISSNGEEIGGGKVRWVNPGRVQAVLTEKSPFNFAILLIPAGIALFVVVGLVVVRLNRGPHCFNCGYRLSSQAIFCPNCGAPRN